MKITDAWIDDPLQDGRIELPMLCVEVDELPSITIGPDRFTGDWIVSKYGPFVKYQQETFPTAAPTATDFNIRFRGRFPVVVDIRLFVCETEQQYGGYSLPLSRARQLVRKYDPSWRLLVNDKIAQSGGLAWLPVQTDPACRQWNGSRICGMRPTSTIRVGEVEMPLCPAHVTERNHQAASKRIAKTA